MDTSVQTELQLVDTFNALYDSLPLKATCIDISTDCQSTMRPTNNESSSNKSNTNTDNPENSNEKNINNSLPPAYNSPNSRVVVETNITKKLVITLESQDGAAESSRNNNTTVKKQQSTKVSGELTLDDYRGVKLSHELKQMNEPEPAPVSKKHQPTPEVKKPQPSPEVKKHLPFSEGKEPSSVLKNASPSPALKEAPPSAEAKDTAPPPEAKETPPSTEVKELSFVLKSSRSPINPELEGDSPNEKPVDSDVKTATGRVTFEDKREAIERSKRPKKSKDRRPTGYVSNPPPVSDDEDDNAIVAQ